MSETTAPSFPTNETAGNLRWLPIHRLRTSYLGLRPGAPKRLPDDTAQLPIRVTPIDDGSYEVIDGFKRLEAWRERGYELIPAVLEAPTRTVEHKRLLLVANSPPRTLTALDEARVVGSLMNQDGLTLSGVARLLRRKPQWVQRRLDIQTHLSPVVQKKLAQEALGPTLAHALCALPKKEQEQVLSCIERHGLTLREALGLVSAYRVADELDRRELLAAPLGVVRREPKSSLNASPHLLQFENQLDNIREALVELENFAVPNDLAPAERRRLKARLHSVLAQLQSTTRVLCCEHPISDSTGGIDDRQQTRPLSQSTTQLQARQSQSSASPGDSSRDRPAPQLLREPRGRPQGGMVSQDRSPRSPRRENASSSHPKKEKSFRLLWDDFLKGSEFESLDELNQRAKLWLDHTSGVANQRVHGTTRRVPNETWRSERQFLIRLPQQRFPVYEQSIRVVDQDATLSIGGTRYTVPALLHDRSVAVRLFAEHFEILDSHQRVVFSRAYAPPPDKGKLIIDPTHYETHKARKSAPSHARLDQAFLKRFPTLEPFLSGLQLRVRKLAPVHIRALLRLAESYGQNAFVAAVSRAQQYRRFDAHAVERILEKNYPLLDDDPVAPLGGAGAALISDVESGSLDDYSDFDLGPSSTNKNNNSEENNGS